jgi:hypothetical protein
VGLLLFKELGIRDNVGFGNESSQNNIFFSRMSMGVCMKVSRSMGIFPVNLVGELVIRQLGENNIQKGKRIILFHFHHKIYEGRNVVKMLEKGVEGGLTMRPNNKGIVNKS